MAGLLPGGLRNHPVPMVLGKAALLGAAGLALYVAGRSVRGRRAAEQLAEERLRLCRLAVRLVAEPLPPNAPDAAYLFHEMDSNLESMRCAALQITERFPEMTLLVVDVNNDELRHPIPNGFGGATKLLACLQSAGIPPSNIELVPFDYAANPMLHTLVESQLVVRHAKARGFRSLIVAAPAFHLPRAAMTVASVCARECPGLEVFPLAGAPLPWEESSVHSQGLIATRMDFLEGELGRIERYTAKGDIAPWGELEERFRRSRV